MFTQENNNDINNDKNNDKNNDINDDMNNEETVILSKEYLYESERKKEKGLLDIGMFLAEKKRLRDNKDKIYKKIEEYLEADFIKDQKFETDNLNLLYDQMCKKNPNLIKQSGLSIMINGDFPKKYAYSLLYIYFLKENIENKNKDIIKLKDDIDYFDEQIDIKDKEIDDLETKLKDPKLTLRIINLREKCIQKNNKIKFMYGLISFLIFTNLIGQKNVIYLFNYLMYILYMFSNYTFIIIKEIGILMYENIWIDILFLFYFAIGFYLYKYNLLRLKFYKND